MTDENDDFKFRTKLPIGRWLEPCSAPLKIAPRQSDKEIAAELRMKMEYAIDAVIDVMAEADRNGLQISFNLGRDPYGRHVITEINIVRQL